MLVFVEGGKPENPEKNPRSNDENQQQTQPTYDVESGNRTRATWWEGSGVTTVPSLLPGRNSLDETKHLLFRLWKNTVRRVDLNLSDAVGIALVEKETN